MTDEEYEALEQLAWASGKKVADWARDVLFERRDGDGGDPISVHVFTELIGLQMLLLGSFGPLLSGQQLSVEQYQEIARTVQQSKQLRAKELLALRRKQEGGVR
ncbi:MAG: hypothetical protein JF563_03070 [Acidobacteriales bacterium]|nr:hypothetical protein [Terriglobales bacterium]